MNLPKQYIQRMRELLGDEEYLLYEQSLDKKSVTGIRINLKKISTEDFEKISPFEIEKIPYTHNGYYVKDTDAVSKHPYYFAGLYYIQESSAMVPAANADVHENDYVLDLCASPGGKTTQILSNNPAFLLSNDISYSRCIPLTKNIDLFGSGSVLISAEKPQKLEMIYPEFFDVILVDAPCSGEGMFRKDSSLIKDWLKKGPEYYQPLQLDILNSAINMLKKGGQLIYSTCTFSPLEDEEVISRVLEENDDLYLDELPHFEGFCSGFDIDGLDFSKCIRLFPHKINGEGHFVAKLKKKADADSSENTKLKKSSKKRCESFIKYDKLPESVKDFLKHINKSKISEYFLINNDCVYMIPENAAWAYNKGLHYVRTGVMVGTLKGAHFIPHNSIALYLESEDFDNVLSLESEDVNVYKYLKGETLIGMGDESINRGYVLICVNNYPLGFAKYDGSKFKNLYTPGWRFNGN